MATRYEYHNTGYDGEGGLTSAWWFTQTFTTTVAYSITAVKLRLRLNLGVTGNVEISIRATDDADKPTGLDLATGIIPDVTTITTDAGGDWYEYAITARDLAAATEYAIILKGDNVVGASGVEWQVDTSTGYADGKSGSSDDAGLTWGAMSATQDYMFETWGAVGNPVDKTYSKTLVAIGGNEFWHEKTADPMEMEELAAANDDINCTIPLNAAVAFQKLFIANGTNLKVADFVNTKIVTANVGTNPPDFGTMLEGTSGAKMIVDYITHEAGAGTCNIYGKRITPAITFPADDPILGTNPGTSCYGVPVSFTMTDVAEVAPPHWYDYTVFGNNTDGDDNFGVMPDKAYQICRYRGRIQLCGDPNYPHQWYQSRQLNPFDYLYVAGDAQSPVAGNDADCGEVGDIVNVAIPYSDDFLIFGCATELWIMSGDAAYGGELNALDTTTGILGDRAWCWDDKSNLYLMCTAGLLRIPKGFGQIENLTIELWPDFISDLAFDASLHRITLAFDPIDRGIHIFKTTLADGVSSSWWYDLRTEGLFPDSYSASHGAFSAVFYQAEDPDYRKLLIGCNDGYIRFLDRTAKNDDSTKITSYVGFAPLALSTHPRKDGIIKNIDIVTGIGDADSSDVTCTVRVARTAGQIIKKLNDGDVAAFTKVFTAPNWNKSNLDRRSIRGQWAALVLTNDTVDESWSMERLIVDTKEIGRSL